MSDSRSASGSRQNISDLATRDDRVVALLHQAFTQSLDDELLSRGEDAVRQAAVALHGPQHRAARAPGASWRLRRWFASAVTAATLATSSGAAVALSADALPGSWLYPVKTASEQVWSALPTPKLTAARIQLRLAERRLDEIERLGPDAGGRVEGLWTAYDRHVARASELAGAQVGAEIRALEDRARLLRPVGADGAADGPPPDGGGAPARGFDLLLGGAAESAGTSTGDGAPNSGDTRESGSEPASDRRAATTTTGDVTDREDDFDEADDLEPQDDASEADEPEDDASEADEPEDDASEADEPEDDASEADEPEDDASEADTDEVETDEADDPPDDHDEADHDEAEDELDSLPGS